MNARYWQKGETLDYTATKEAVTNGQVVSLGGRIGVAGNDIAKGETVATDTSLYAAVLKYLGASDQAIQNYLDSYFGKLSVSQDGDTLIPTIIWSYVAAENLGGTNRIYTIGDVESSASSTRSVSNPSAFSLGRYSVAWTVCSSSSCCCSPSAAVD